MAGEFVAGAIVSKILLDTKKWGDSVSKVKSDTKSMKGMSEKTSAQFRKMGTGMTVAGAAIVGATTKMIGKFVETGDWIDKMSKRTGIGAEALSELAHAADISGAGLNDIEKSVKKMAKSITDADSGLTTYQRSFERLGLDWRKIADLSPEEQFTEIGGAIANLKSETEMAATAQEIFGRSGTTLLPLFKEGKEGIRKLREEAHALGVVYDTEMAESAAELKDAQTRLKESFQGVGIALSTSLAPALTEIVDKITGVITKVSDWAKKNPGLSGTIMKVTLGLGALLSTMGPLMMMIPGLTKGFNMMFRTAGGGISTFGKLGAVATAAFIGWEIGKRIGEVKILGKSINEHLIGGFESLTDKIMGLGKEEEKTSGATAAFEKRQRMLAEASEIAGEEITSIQDAMDILEGSATKAERIEKKMAETTKEVGEEAGGLDVVLKDLRNTVEELESPFDNFTLQQFQLANAFAGGEIGMGQYVRRMADLREERERNLALFDEEEFAIDDSVEGVETYIAEWESVPSALGSVLDQVGIKVAGINDEISEDTGKTTTEVRNKYGDLTDGMITDWSQTLGEFIKSGDLFKGDFSGLMNGVSDIFTDTLGNMLTMFINDFVGGILSGASDAAGGILSSLGSALGGGGGGAGGLASGVNSITGALGGLANPVNMISGAITAVASVVTALQGPGGPSSTDSWHFEQIWINTKELRDYTFLNIGGSGGWLAKIHDKTNSVVLKNEYQMRQNRKMVGSLQGIEKDTGSIRNNVAKIPGLLSDISKSIGSVVGAQEGHVSRKPELVMVHGTSQDPEYIFRESQMNNLGRGGANISIVMPSEFNVNGTIIGDREYFRQRLFPEFIAMLRSNFGKQELKSALGVS